MDWLKTIAPTIATAMGGPLAGMAVDAIGSALGMKDATKEQVKDLLASGTLTSDQMASIKQADASLKVRMKELEIDMEKVHAGDRNSAREMAARTGDVWTPRLMAIVVFMVWGAVNYKLFNGTINGDMRELVARALGTLDAVLMAVIYYYYGSSSSSAAKTEAMAGKK
ncbi:hypothetical protein UFOVP159_44 [uncultured Caudovirales phage]|uniref:Holin of 3TMs, for gene-transfer release n=1 Tax=uncultured Caudovirales phage TaxID=2100421 RepID=A0A6J7WBA2_9CAUD|nr:hypothetical protein UFOVP159_44 [uncultured Caudovirales phage]